jgi:hypothetical protein
VDGNSGGLCSWRYRSFGENTIGLTLTVVLGNGGFLVVSLLKKLFGDWTFSRVKTHDLTFVVGPDGDGGYIVLPSWRPCVLVNVSESRCCCHSCCYVPQIASMGPHIFFRLFFFCLCILDV